MGARLSVGMADAGPGAGRRGEGRRRLGPQNAGPRRPPLLGLACLLSIPALACATSLERSGGRGLPALHPPRAPPEGPPSLVFHWLGWTPCFPPRSLIGRHAPELRLSETGLEFKLLGFFFFP